MVDLADQNENASSNSTDVVGESFGSSQFERPLGADEAGIALTQERSIATWSLGS